MERETRQIDSNRAYFLLSFGIRSLPLARNGLIPLSHQMYFCLFDFSIWLRFELFDSGWGNTFGLERYPRLDFDGLMNVFLYGDKWEKLSFNKRESNVYGASIAIADRFFDKLLLFLTNNSKGSIDLSDEEYNKKIQFLLNNLYIDEIIRLKSSVQYYKWNQIKEQLCD